MRRLLTGNLFIFLSTYIYLNNSNYVFMSFKEKLNENVLRKKQNQVKICFAKKISFSVCEFWWYIMYSWLSQRRTFSTTDSLDNKNLSDTKQRNFLLNRCGNPDKVSLSTIEILQQQKIFLSFASSLLRESIVAFLSFF